ncbi:MGH1-like glycoside hydrolase domain-containing protein [Ectothiorhodospira variabilis]|uniref:MGH1-like glycoside hydrolase domain-containing protein n=1 Tax=Ectothiorhodospira variabilis TaxID=505694 RepID=UPI001EFB355B|nr:glucosidase [Ectothiorhodospira variabilis]
MNPSNKPAASTQSHGLCDHRTDSEASAEWRLWGPYLSERAWGTVREDYSADGEAWDYFGHDDAIMRAFRWGEDGIGGLCDEQQRLIFAPALWNGRDPILKERLFGFSGPEGSHGEDVKEYYFHLDAGPGHRWLAYRYKYPHAAFPYDWLKAENARRDRRDTPVDLLESGAFDQDRYWDLEITYAKAGPRQILICLEVHNRGPVRETLYLLPRLWFRNTWSWGDGIQRPRLRAVEPLEGAAWAVRAEHATLGTYLLRGQEAADSLFTENETNFERLWGEPNPQPFVKDAFHRYLIAGEAKAVNPERVGTSFMACHRLTIEAGESVCVHMVLSEVSVEAPFADWESVRRHRRQETDRFFDGLLPNADQQDRRILRQALSGLLWNKQFYSLDVARWLDGDQHPPPPERGKVRNAHWRHLKVQAVISMPDKWEYPWFAAWDLAFHSASLALVDVGVAKQQLELLLGEQLLHPHGLIPAYEWDFGDANPPVHAMAALKVFRAERVQSGCQDHRFLKRVLHKLLLHFAWWMNRKDPDGHHLYEGGFLGLDNISVFNRSEPLPPGHVLKQADATGWMAMFALNLTLMALELTTEDSNYEDIAIQCYTQFLNIAAALSGGRDGAPSLWDEADGFYKDLVLAPDGQSAHVDVYSWVGIVPLFACEVVDQRLLRSAPRFARLLAEHGGGGFDGHVVCACPEHENERGEHLLALASPEQVTRILQRVLDEGQLLSRFGVRSLSREHATHQDLGNLPGIGHAHIAYQPGEADSGMFGGNSNWRGPIWLPLNYLLVQTLEKYHRYAGASLTLPAPCLDGEPVTLRQAGEVIAQRLVNLFRRDARGLIPAFPPDSPLQNDPHWQDMMLFHEYFHAETGRGLGAQHQTGWTALVANLLLRRYREEVPDYWQGSSGR